MNSAQGHAASSWRSLLGMQGWWPVLVGLCVLYIPMYVDIATVYWRGGHDAAGAFVLVVAVWLIARTYRQFDPIDNGKHVGRPALSVPFLAVGIACYVLGRSQHVYQLQVISQIPILLGVGFMLLEPKHMRGLLFPVMLLLFLVPVPGSVMDELLLPLKQWVSQLVTWILYSTGYPIARNGVVITIANYELLIADACSGLNSMVALFGIGLLYIHLAAHSSRWRNAVLLMSVLPIAFMANVIRVLALVLVTYYAGDRAGRSFHNNAGLLEILAAFAGFFMIDRLLQPVTNAGASQALKQSS